RLPLIRLVEGSGGGGSVKTIETTGRANVPAVDGWEWVVANMGTIPRVALGLGSVAGLGAAHLAAAHYSIMIKEKSALFVAGPPVVERLGQKLTKNELGGWEIQLKAGAVDDAVDTEDEAFARARRFLSFLPSSIDELAPRGPRDDDQDRKSTRLNSSHVSTSYAVFCLKKKKLNHGRRNPPQDPDRRARAPALVRVDADLRAGTDRLAPAPDELDVALIVD